ncbi:MAG TPA: adenylate kinase [Patescibacteria group bacterium]|nr:adenylate kinase [Patescibacteria group bacterium]
MTECSPQRIVLFGPQGAGKGTQAERLSAYFGIPHISTGNIFRKAIAEQTELGKKVKAIIAEGKLVPDSVTNALVAERLQEEDCMNGFILDGYPRNLIQAEALDSLTTISCAFVIDMPDQESIRRLSQRRVCINCGATYHLEFKSPLQPNICDVCGHQLLQRDDDKPASIKERLHIYHVQTKPLIMRYRERNVLCHVEGVGSIDDVWHRMMSCFS